jgi:hypothetical protein
MATNPWTAEIARINSVIQQTLRNIARDQSYLAAGFFPAGTNAATLREQIASGEAFLADKRAELAIFQAEYQNFGKDSTASAGQVVAEEAQARAEGAAASNPSTPSSVLAPNGRINANNVERGTDDPVKTQVQTQSTPPAGDGNALPFVQTSTGLNVLAEDLDAAEQPYVVTQAGAGANRDDNTRPNTNATAQIINASFNQRIVPEPNVLDDYASYTYAITWYLLTPEQYNEMIRSQKKNCASWQLLIQSGGAPTQAAGVTAGSTATAGRNQFFDLDYYIDDLEIDSLVPLKGTGAANTATDIKFKVTEPNGITLIENLYKAVSNLYKQKNVSKTANYPMAQYCLVVRFYGYNDNGELVTTGRRGTNGKTNLTDPRAIVEKFYPFVITNIKFRIPKDRVVEYAVEGKPIPHFYNKSQDRGTIPFAFELIGETAEQVLRGNPVGTVYPTSPGERRSSPQPNTSAPTQPAVVSGDANQDLGGGTASSLGVSA